MSVLHLVGARFTVTGRRDDMSCASPYTAMHQPTAGPPGAFCMPRTDSSPDRSPAPHLEMGRAFMRSQLLLVAVELGLFGALAAGPLAADALRERLGLHPRG